MILKLNQKNNQSGFASVVIALVVILVLSLLTLGFAQLARREQNIALNKQLANQAFYAAESGINDVLDSITTIKALSAAGTINSTDCISDNLWKTVLGHDPEINSAKGISYTCAIVDVKPRKQTYTQVASNVTRSSVFSLDGAVNEITINWSSATGKNTARSPGASGCAPTGTCFPPTTSWQSPAVIKASITPLGTGPLTRQELQDKTFTVYLYPSSDGGTVTYDPTNTLNNQAAIVGGGCSIPGGSTTLGCHVTINGIGGASTNEYYLLRMTNMYDESNILVDKAKTVTGAVLSFDDGFIKIDVTGKAKTVLKRMQVTFKVTGNTVSDDVQIVDQPNTIIEAGNLCKRLAVYNGTTEYFDVDGNRITNNSGPCYNRN